MRSIRNNPCSHAPAVNIRRHPFSTVLPLPRPVTPEVAGSSPVAPAFATRLAVRDSATSAVPGRSRRPSVSSTRARSTRPATTPPSPARAPSTGPGSMRRRTPRSPTTSSPPPRTATPSRSPPAPASASPTATATAPSPVGSRWATRPARPSRSTCRRPARAPSRSPGCARSAEARSRSGTGPGRGHAASAVAALAAGSTMLCSVAVGRLCPMGG